MIPDLLLRQAVSGKAPAGMRLIDEDALLDRRVLVLDRFCLFYIGIEDPDAGQVASIGNGADDGQQPWPGGGNSSWRAPRSTIILCY